MTLDEYVHAAVQLRGVDNELWQLALGVGGEAGEVQEVIKKSYRPNKSLDIAHAEEELGDLLWYVVNIADKLGLNVETIMKKNITKLTVRYAS